MTVSAEPFDVLIPARLSSTRLPNKALADIAGEPMIVRVARCARASRAERVVVATDDASIHAAVLAAGFEALMTRADHRCGTDRLAEAAEQLALAPTRIVVNVQGDEPQMPPELIDRVAHCLAEHDDCVMATAAHPIDDPRDWFNSNVVKVVTDCAGFALYFSRAPIPFARDTLRLGVTESLAAELRLDGQTIPSAASQFGLPARHIGIYAYRAAFLRQFPELASSPLERIESLEQLRVLWHGYSIAVASVDTAPPAGVDTAEDLVRVRRALQAGR